MSHVCNSYVQADLDQASRKGKARRPGWRPGGEWRISL